MLVDMHIRKVNAMIYSLLIKAQLNACHHRLSLALWRLSRRSKRKRAIQHYVFTSSIDDAQQIRDSSLCHSKPSHFVPTKRPCGSTRPGVMVNQVPMLSPKGLVEAPRPGLNMIHTTSLSPKGCAKAPRSGLKIIQVTSMLHKGPVAAPRPSLSVNQAVYHNVTPASLSLLKEEIHVVSGLCSNSDSGVDNNGPPAASTSKKKRR